LDHRAVFCTLNVRNRSVAVESYGSEGRMGSSLDDCKDQMLLPATCVAGDKQSNLFMRKS
jgi:hypothetical protein